MMKMLGSGKYRGVLRFLLLATQSCLGGVVDSVLSPYFCPVARQHGLGSVLCGVVISARFATQILFLLIFGKVMRTLGARTIYMGSVAMCATFNMLLATVDMIEDKNLFTALSFIFVILSTIGDAGIFCSIYILAGQEHFSFSCARRKGKKEEFDKTNTEKDDNDGERTEDSEEKKVESSASGPAWMEATYACGSMLGPPIGGFIFLLGGFGATILTAGVFMALIGLLTYPLYFTCDNNERGEAESGMVGDDLNNNDAPSITAGQSEYKTQDQSVISESEEKKEQLSYLKALSNVSILYCCLMQVSSGIAGSWYLSSLESHLTMTMSLTVPQVGLVYMCPGLVYMLLTPVFGYLLDKGFKQVYILMLAVLATFLGYLLLGPSSLLSSLSPSPAYTITGLLLQGFGLSATSITTLNFMLDSIEEPEDESNAGMVTSLWESCEMIGGYLGSTFGGLGADRFGFRGGINIVLCVELFVLVVLMFLLTRFWHMRKVAHVPAVLRKVSLR